MARHRAFGRLRRKCSARKSIHAVLGDGRGEWRVEDRHLTAKRREVLNTLAARAIRWHQLRHRAAQLRDQDLAPLPDLIQKRREVPTGLADFSGAHEASVRDAARSVNSVDVEARRVSAIGH